MQATAFEFNDPAENTTILHHVSDIEMEDVTDDQLVNAEAARLLDLIAADIDVRGVDGDESAEQLIRAGYLSDTGSDKHYLIDITSQGWAFLDGIADMHPHILFPSN